MGAFISANDLSSDKTTPNRIASFIQYRRMEKVPGGLYVADTLAITFYSKIRVGPSDRKKGPASFLPATQKTTQ